MILEQIRGHYARNTRNTRTSDGNGILLASHFSRMVLVNLSTDAR
jgi:hypothetical protein